LRFTWKKRYIGHRYRVLETAADVLHSLLAIAVRSRIRYRRSTPISRTHARALRHRLQRWSTRTAESWLRCRMQWARSATCDTAGSHRPLVVKTWERRFWLHSSDSKLSAQSRQDEQRTREPSSTFVVSRLNGMCSSAAQVEMCFDLWPGTHALHLSVAFVRAYHSKKRVGLSRNARADTLVTWTQTFSEGARVEDRYTWQRTFMYIS
jgi:hypothetical protein